MGNCQATDLAAAATVEYPGGRVERLFDLAVPAQRLMSDYPGYFVAMIPTSILHPPSSAATTTTTTSTMHAAHHQSQPSFKLLAADAPLRIGHRYRLVSFEEVLTRFSQGDAHGNFTSSINVNASHIKIITTKEHLKPGRANSMSNHVIKIGC